MNTEEMAYVRIIRSLRKKVGRTQKEVAEALGIAQTIYARYERGANAMPIRHLITLSQYYGVSTDYILNLGETQQTGNSPPKVGRAESESGKETEDRYAVRRSRTPEEKGRE